MAVQSLQCEEAVLEAGLERPHRLGPSALLRRRSECVYLLTVMAWEERG